MRVSGPAPARAVVVHDVPGRLRVRLPAAWRAERALEALRAQDGVRELGWSPRTRSLLVEYDREATSGAAIRGVMAERLGLDPDALEPATAPRRPRPARPSPIAGAIAQAVGEVDDRLASATRGLLDLGTIVPLALGAWAIRELLGGRVAPLAWSTALWYAHGLFRDYNLPARD
jgi:hypothetical protein